MPALPDGDNYGLPGWLLSGDAWELELEVDVWSLEFEPDVDVSEQNLK